MDACLSHSVGNTTLDLPPPGRLAFHPYLALALGSYLGTGAGVASSHSQVQEIFPNPYVLFSFSLTAIKDGTEIVHHQSMMLK